MNRCCLSHSNKRTVPVRLSVCLSSMRPPYMSPGYSSAKALLPLPSEMVGVAPPWQGRSIAGPKLRLVEFSAYAEKHKEGEGVSISKDSQH